MTILTTIYVYKVVNELLRLYCCLHLAASIAGLAADVLPSVSINIFSPRGQYTDRSTPMVSLGPSLFNPWATDSKISNALRTRKMMHDTTASGNGPRSFKHWSSEQNGTLALISFSNYPTIPTGGLRLIQRGYDEVFSGE
ncbi:hypothetical protein TNCV_947811 [Trichonephila clavipes]|nr:hypothetical protein TNCV_947811 [Trichonephila clavipes]